MIDNLSILLSHGLLALAFWILVNRADLDQEDPPAPDAEPEGFAAKRPSPNRAFRNHRATPDA
jgi:hypothetical protein